MSERRPPLPGHVIGYACVVVVVAMAARMTWELMQPLLPIAITLLVLAGIYWLMLGRMRL